MDNPSYKPYSQEQLDSYYALREQIAAATRTLPLSNFRGERLYFTTATDDRRAYFTIQADLLVSTPLDLKLSCIFCVKEGCPVSLRLLESIWEFDPITSQWVEVS